MSTDRRVRMFESHSPGCYLADRGAQEFIVYGGDQWKAKDGSRRSNSTCWLTFKCNNPSCKGIAAVRWDALMEFVSEGLQS